MMTYAKMKVVAALTVVALVAGAVGAEATRSTTAQERPLALGESPATMKASAGTQPTTEAVPTELDVRPGDGVGPIRLGMEMKEVERLLGEPTRRVATSGTIEYVPLGMVVTSRQGTTQVRAIVGGRPIGLPVFAGRTAEGLGIGSTGEQIKAAYGEPDRYTSAPGSFENLRYDKRGISFTLKDGQCMQLAVMTFQSNTTSQPGSIPR